MRPKNRACSMPMASECVETFPAELKQLVASWLRHAGLRPGTAIAQLFATDQAVVAIAIGGDAVEGEPGPPCASQDSLGHVLLRGRAAAAEQFHQHQGLIDVAHAHALGDGLPQAKEGGRGAVGHGVMLAAAGRPGQVWLWAARQVGDPAGIPFGLAVMRLQPTRRRVWVARPSPRPELSNAVWGRVRLCEGGRQAEGREPGSNSLSRGRGLSDSEMTLRAEKV